MADLNISNDLIYPNFEDVLVDDYGADEVWPMVDIASGTTVHAAVNGARDGTLNGTWLYQHAEVIPWKKGPFSGETNTYADIYSSSLQSIFNGIEGSILLLFRASSRGIWRSGYDNARLGEFRADGSNYFLFTLNGDNEIRFSYRENNLNRLAEHTITSTPTGWVMIGVTWSDTAGFLRAYVNGSQVDEVAITGVFTGSLSAAKIGSDQAGANPCPGWYSYAAVKFGTVWSAQDFSDIYDDYQDLITRTLFVPTLTTKEFSVTNLNDSGTGSLRAACEQPYPADITIDISGIIDCPTMIDVHADGISIDGSSAPNGGICLKYWGMRVYGDNFYMKHIRIRPGPPAVGSTSHRCLGIHGDNALVEYCSFSWCTDDSVGLYGDTNEVRYCIISEALRDSNNPEGPQSYGVRLSGPDNLSFHHNIIALNYYRNPKINLNDSLPTNNGHLLFANNVIYGCTHFTLSDSPINKVQYMDIMGNYYKWRSGSSNDEIYSQDDLAANNQTYLENNIGPNRPDDEDPETDIIPTDLARFTILESPTRTKPGWLEDAFDAYDTVLANTGATLPKQDSVDKRILGLVNFGGGVIVDDPTDAGGWPDLTEQRPIYSQDFLTVTDSVTISII